LSTPCFYLFLQNSAFAMRRCGNDLNLFATLPPGRTLCFRKLYGQRN
jgi:hypothetical protein